MNNFAKGNDQDPFSKPAKKVDIKSSNFSNTDSIEVQILKDKKFPIFNYELGSKCAEEFWDDAKEGSRSKLTDETLKNKDDSSFIVSKKNKYDNSLSKTVDFDDLITGGKITKNESGYLNSNAEYIESQTYNKYISTEPNVSIVKKVSDKSMGQTSIALTQPNTSIRDSNHNNSNYEKYVINNIVNNKQTVMKISNKNVSRSTDKTPARNNGTNNYKSTIVTTNKQTNKTNVGNSNMKYNSVASRTKTQNRYASQDNRKETRLPIETNLKTNSLVLNKNLDNHTLKKFCKFFTFLFTR